MDWLYWVVDVVRPSFKIFLKTIAQPKTEKEKLYAKSPETFRKAVERLFGVLFSLWHIVAHPSNLSHTADMNEIFKACTIMIMHNMIFEFRDEDGTIGTNNIVTFDPNVEIVLIRTSSLPLSNYDVSDL